MLSIVAIGVSAVVLLPRLLGIAAGPEAEIITALKKAEAAGFELELPEIGAKLRSRKARFDRISVTFDPAAKAALATATLDFEGALGPTEVSSLGLERIPFLRTGYQWAPEQGLAPRLSAAVEALERRRRALESGDASALAALCAGGDSGVVESAEEVLRLRRRSYRSLAWFIRSEREEVVVREEYRLQGDTPDRPVDRPGAVRLLLQSNGREFFFSGGLM
ncbi:MAG: hypothetical protein HYZ28_05345 [Myxococcales bacterium]|nr:hypothetical protein [Myxococcales bacterium]